MTDEVVSDNRNGHPRGNNNEHDRQSLDYRYSAAFSSSFGDNENNTGGFEFPPTSTARLPYGGGGGGDAHHAYGSLSSRLDPVLLPSIDPFGQQSGTSTQQQQQQQRTNSGVQMSSMGGSLRLPALPGNTNGRMMNDTSAYPPDMNAVVRPDTSANQQPQDPTTRTNRYSSSYTHPFPSNAQADHRAGGSTSEFAFSPDKMAFDRRILSTDGDEPPASSRGGRREDDYLIHSHAHRKKFLGASSSQIFVKWLDEESGGMNPSSHLKHGMTAAEEMTLPGQSELCHHPLPPPSDLETYVATYFSTFHILYPVVDEPWLRAQLDRPKSQMTGEDIVAPVVYLVVSLGASMMSPGRGHAAAAAVSKTYFDQAWKALSVILGRPFRSSVQALVLMAVALRLVSSGQRQQGRNEVSADTLTLIVVFVEVQGWSCMEHHWVG